MDIFNDKTENQKLYENPEMLIHVCAKASFEKTDTARGRSGLGLLKRHINLLWIQYMGENTKQITKANLNISSLLPLI